MRPNYHHICFDRVFWSAQPDANAIRNNHWLKPEMDLSVHNLTHISVTTVPVPDRFMLRRIRRDYEPVVGNYIASLDVLIRTVDLSTRHPKASALEKNLGQLTVMALELQRPFIIEGIVRRK